MSRSHPERTLRCHFRVTTLCTPAGVIVPMAKTKRTRSQAQDQSEQDAQDTELGGMKGGYRVDGKTTTEDDGVEHFEVPFNEKSIICERRGKGKPSLIFTHGAGGGLSNPATKDFADGFAEVASVVTFQGTMNLQNRFRTFNSVIENEHFDSALGGRSMGARAATIAASQDDRDTKALVLVSFPLVGGKKGESRESILLDLPEGVDALFITGSKDAMCSLEHLRKVMGTMKARSWLLEVEGADHSMSWKPKATVEAMRKMTGAVAARWLTHRDSRKQYSCIRMDEESGEVVHTGWVERFEGDDHATPTAGKTKKRRTK